MATFGEITSAQLVPMMNDGRFPPTGGTTGQVLKKASNTDHDYAWADDETSAGGNPFPVGSVFLSVVSTNPATLLGYGTWAAIAAGRMLVGLNAGDADFDTVEETGGAKTVTLTEQEIPPHTHVQNAHTHVQNAHQHNISHVRSATTGGATTLIARTSDTSSTVGADVLTDNATAVNQNATAVNQNAGGGQAHNNLPPYFVVYIWKRTA